MLLQEFDQLSTSCNLLQANGRYFGTYSDFPFAATVNRQASGIVTFQFKLSASLENGAFKTLNKAMPKGYTLAAVDGNSYNLICIGSKLKHSEFSLPQALNLFVRGLRESGISPSDICPVCSRGQCDSYADLGGYSAAHRACVESLSDSAANSAKQSIQSGSYVTGIIGALIGGLIACIPNILAYYAGWMVGYLYALVPLGTYFGYKLCRGRMNRSAFFFTCIISIFHLFSMEQIIFYFDFHEVLGIWPSMLETVRLYWSVATPQMLLEDMGMSAVFMALGLWISWGQIRRNAFTDLRMAGAVRDTLTSKQNAFSATAAESTDDYVQPTFSTPEL